MSCYVFRVCTLLETGQSVRLGIIPDELAIATVEVLNVASARLRLTQASRRGHIRALPSPRWSRRTPTRNLRLLNRPSRKARTSGAGQPSPSRSLCRRGALGRSCFDGLSRPQATARMRSPGLMRQHLLSNEHRYRLGGSELGCDWRSTGVRDRLRGPLSQGPHGCYWGNRDLDWLLHRSGGFLRRYDCCPKVEVYGITNLLENPRSCPSACADRRSGGIDWARRARDGGRYDPDLRRRGCRVRAANRFGQRANPRERASSNHESACSRISYRRVG
jgi:hypothetical protein